MEIGSIVEYDGQKYVVAPEEYPRNCAGCEKKNMHSCRAYVDCNKNKTILKKYVAVKEQSSVYGKKIVIDGVEYVAVPDKESGCKGCAFKLDDCDPLDELFEKAFGGECDGLGFILKKVTPKKKPEKTFVAFKTEKAWSVNPSRVLGFTPEQKKQIVSILAETNEVLKAQPIRCAQVPITPTQYIVCLSESGNLAPSETPHQHNSELAATKEAQRLCRKHNQKFVVLKVVVEVKPEIQTKVTKR